MEVSSERLAKCLASIMPADTSKAGAGVIMFVKGLLQKVFWRQ